MSDEIEGYISGGDRDHKKDQREKSALVTPGSDRPVQISVLKRGPIVAETGRIQRPAKVISMIERLEHKSKVKMGLPKVDAVSQEFRMSVGQMAYLKFRKQQRQIRLRMLRRDLITFVLSLMLLLSSAYITYQVTSAWFTNRSVNISTFIGDDAAKKLHRVEAQVFHRHHKIVKRGEKNLKNTAVANKSPDTILNTPNNPAGE